MGLKTAPPTISPTHFADFVVLSNAERGGSTMKKAIGYLRVSTAGQATDGVSLDAQRERIEAWAKAHDFELLGIQRDAGISGGKASNRPGLQKALDLACKERAALVVYSLSRLARSTRDALEISARLDKAGADLVSLSESIDTLHPLPAACCFACWRSSPNLNAIS